MNFLLHNASMESGKYLADLNLIITNNQWWHATRRKPIHLEVSKTKDQMNLKPGQTSAILFWIGVPVKRSLFLHKKPRSIFHRTLLQREQNKRDERQIYAPRYKCLIVLSSIQIPKSCDIKHIHLASRFRDKLPV